MLHKKCEVEIGTDTAGVRARKCDTPTQKQVKLVKSKAYASTRKNTTTLPEVMIPV